MKDIIIIVVSVIFIIIFIIFATLSIVDKFSNSTFFCNKIGWHKAPLKQGFDGCSSNGTCPRCGKKVLQDSNGDWF